MQKNNRLTKIKLLKRLIDNQENMTMRQLQAYNMQLKAEEKQLVTLKNYKNEYEKEFNSLNNLKNTFQIVNVSNFINHIGTVIEQQKIVINNINDKYQKTKKKWQSIYNRKKVIHDYMNRLQNLENIQIQKTIQLEQDKVAAEMYIRKNLDN